MDLYGFPSPTKKNKPVSFRITQVRPTHPSSKHVSATAA